jgi:lantibiotic modifying enzyme
VPAFTRLLAPGLGLAEDPGDGDSFGMHRCRLLADALVTAHEQGAHSVEARVDAVLDRFAREGINPDRPYLNPGSDDRYTFDAPAAPVAPRTRSSLPGRDSDAGTDRGLYLEAAHTIGRRLAGQAVWHEGMCNWLAADPATGRADSTEPLTYRSLDAGLYSGTAGVALFLAELTVRTGDADARSTALGAARHALARADDIAPAMRPALYSGALGVALAVGRVGLLLDAPELTEQARALSASVASGDLTGTGRPHDMLSGSAGGILACLALDALFAGTYLESFAARLAGDVLVGGRPRRGRRSWPAVGFTTYGHLTGFSHGAAGIATALLEWWRASGDVEYRRAADEAFAYEQARFHSGLGNWPDLREPAAVGTGGRRVYTYHAFWCHGAPGIALSRLHAYALTAEPDRRAEAAAALETTRRAVAADLDGAAPALCLCHGLPGNADVLAHAPLLDPAAPSPPDEASRAATRVARHYLSARDDPPSPSLFGAPDDHPSLMLGHAGAGYALLRCLPSPPPSVLLVQPHEWRPAR